MLARLDRAVPHVTISSYLEAWKESNVRTDGSVTNWIRDAKDGDEQAAQRLWDRYFERLIELASRHLRNAPKRMSDEEDVVLSTLNSVLAGARSGKFPLLQNRDDLWGLLLVITVRKASNQKKHQLRLRRGGGKQRGESVFEAIADGAGIAQIVGHEPTPEMAAMLTDEIEHLLARLADPTLQQIAVWKMEGYTNDEMADKLACSKRTVIRKFNLIRQIAEAEE
ncbi:MAG: ECF-type sigma factor [Planctomycetota bacterium]